MPTESLSQPDKKVPDPLGFFQVVHEKFQEAERNAGGPLDVFCEMAGYKIRLRFAGPALVPFILPALEHLIAAPCSAPALTICLWDSVSTQTRMPPPPWVPDARRVPYFESGAPLLTILHWWMGCRQRQLIHAGAVGSAQGGVLLVGKGGSGKSSTCLLCLDSPLLYAGDDYCLITTKSAPHVHSIYSSGKVDAKDIGRFPFLAPALNNADHLDREKALYFLHPHFPGKISAGFPIRAILLPRVTGRRETGLKEISASESLLALAPSTIFQLTGAGHEAFKRLNEMVKQVPSFVIELGINLAEIPATISRLITSLSE